MASHREQHHSFVLPDGTYGIIINTGNGTGNALQLFVSNNNGASWTSVSPNPFTNTATGTASTNGSVSTDDVVVGATVGNVTEVLVAYDQDPVSGLGNSAVLSFTELLYNQMTHVWSVRSGYPQTVDQASHYSATVLFQQPSVGIDYNGNIWVSSMMRSSSAPDSINIYYYNGGGSWTNTGLSVPIPTAGYSNHAPQLALLPSTIGNLGLIFQNKTSLYWGIITATGTTPTFSISFPSATNPLPFATNLPPAQEEDEDTAYSMVTDRSGNTYLGYATDTTAGVSSGVDTATFTASSNTWASNGELTSTSPPLPNPNYATYVKATYVKDSTTGDYVLMVVNDYVAATQVSSLAVYAAPAINNGGGAYKYQYDLFPPAASSGTYSNPRIEQPGLINTLNLTNGTMPVFEQYTNSGGNQSLIEFALTASF
jgi:hypothetical protein